MRLLADKLYRKLEYNLAHSYYFIICKSTATLMPISTLDIQWILPECQKADDQANTALSAFVS